MNPFEIVLFLLAMCFGFGVATFACFWLSTEPGIQTSSPLERVLEFATRMFVALSAICGALAVLVTCSALLAPFTGGGL